MIKSLVLLLSSGQFWSLVSSLLPVAVQFSHDWVTGQAGNATCVFTVTSHQDEPLLSPFFTPTSGIRKPDGLVENPCLKLAVITF